MDCLGEWERAPFSFLQPPAGLRAISGSGSHRASGRPWRGCWSTSRNRRRTPATGTCFPGQSEDLTLFPTMAGRQSSSNRLTSEFHQVYIRLLARPPRQPVPMRGCRSVKLFDTIRWFRFSQTTLRRFFSGGTGVYNPNFTMLREGRQRTIWGKLNLKR